MTKANIFIHRRLQLCEDYFSTLCERMMKCAQQEAKLRDNNDKLVETLFTSADKEKITTSLRETIKNVAANMSSIEDYRDAYIRRIEKNLLSNMAAYEHHLRNARSDVVRSLKARQKEVAKYQKFKTVMDRADSRSTRRAKADADRAAQEAGRAENFLMEQMLKLEEKKLEDSKFFIETYLKTQMHFHARSLQMLSESIKKISSLNIADDLSNFEKTFGINMQQSGSTISQLALNESDEEYDSRKGKRSKYMDRAMSEPNLNKKSEKHHVKFRKAKSKDNIRRRSHRHNDSTSSDETSSDSDDENQTESEDEDTRGQSHRSRSYREKVSSTKRKDSSSDGKSTEESSSDESTNRYYSKRHLSFGLSAKSSFRQPDLQSSIDSNNFKRSLSDLLGDDSETENSENSKNLEMYMRKLMLLKKEQNKRLEKISTILSELVNNYEKVISNDVHDIKAVSGTTNKRKRFQNCSPLMSILNPNAICY
ncbi:hypothetical protein SNEBB_009448 [Seison nebaliae]|nr:hypothetical protein SNEBB_009448 [Seison nebaliae]